MEDRDERIWRAGYRQGYVDGHEADKKAKEPTQTDPKEAKTEQKGWERMRDNLTRGMLNVGKYLGE